MIISPADKGTKTVYTTCRCNCGGNCQCVLKAHVKDGKVIAVEPDDRYNPNAGREDEAVSESDLLKIRLQRRPCTMGLLFHRYLYHPDRILYPLKRAPGSKRGEEKFVRISWEEALTTIAGKMNEMRGKYGPLSILTQYRPNMTQERLFSLWGAGAEVWGWCSYEPARMMAHVIAGGKGWELSGWSSGSAADMLANSKVIVLWGCDPTVGHQGPAHQFAWFIKMARERGVPVIIIDPRYSAAAEIIADQWIPIKPGTDVAMFLAMAYVLLEKDLWNKEFVDKYVEPVGFNKWKDYIQGVEDGVSKTPEWAETKCGVPAETIRSLATLIGTQKPAWLWAHWSLSRKSHGEQVIGAFAGLQAMMGYWGTPGAGPAIHIGPCRPVPMNHPWGTDGDYKVPKLFRREYWAQAILWLDKVRSGEMDEKEYMRKIGWRADPALLKQFNPKMILWGIAGGKPYTSDHLVTLCDSANEQVKALEKMEFIVCMHSMMVPTLKYADIILPADDWMWEEKAITKNAPYGAFECINYCPQVAEPAGETKSWLWVYVKLAEKLGIDPKKMFKYYTTDENWEKDWERYLKDQYQGITEYFKKKNHKVPSWEKFTQGEFINCDEYDEQPFTGWDEQIKEGKPFKTATGKIELYSSYLDDETNKGKGEHYDTFGRIIDNLPGDWGNMPPMAKYMTMVRGMDDPLTGKYPLMLITPHSRYRVHYLFWEHNWLREYYRHRIWINVADAKARGIEDGDSIEVFNDRGKVIMPAYVTSRIMPGIVVLHAGGKFIPDENGIDHGAAPSTLLGGDYSTCTTPAKATNLVQVEKYDGEK
jgi:anaerobic dimethyl sulfoxide reductase subunit A